METIVSQLYRIDEMLTYFAMSIEDWAIWEKDNYPDPFPHITTDSGLPALATLPIMGSKLDAHKLYALEKMRQEFDELICSVGCPTNLHDYDWGRLTWVYWTAVQETPDTLA